MAPIRLVPLRVVGPSPPLPLAPRPPSPTPPSTPVGLPDLVIDRAYLGPDPEHYGRWNIEVRNAGNAPAAPSKTALERGGSAELLDTPALAPGASVTVTTPCLYGSLGTGTARADATNVVAESREDNNDRAFGPYGTNGRCRYP